MNNTEILTQYHEPFTHNQHNPISPLTLSEAEVNKKVEKLFHRLKMIGISDILADLKEPIQRSLNIGPKRSVRADVSGSIVTMANESRVSGFKAAFRCQGDTLCTVRYGIHKPGC